jgi:NADH pyrophosphatase NudC (nudix superfamily)
MSESPKEFFKYCPRCGTSYDPAFVSDNRLDCKKCAFVFYQNPKTAVNAIVLNEKQEVLLARRAFDLAKGTTVTIEGLNDNSAQRHRRLSGHLG